MVPNLAFGDAISQQAVTIRGLLRSLGLASEIYSQNIDVRLQGQARPYKRFREEQGDEARVLFHFSIGSEVADAYRLLPNPRTLVYHNITPPHFFRGVNEAVARLCSRGRKELADLRASSDSALADSELNASEIRELGYDPVEVFPIVLDPARFDRRPERWLERAYRDGHVNLLHVGRLVPNKRLEDLLKVFYFFRRKIQPDSRLLLVGIDTDMEVYSFALRQMIEDLGIPGVAFLGRATRRELTTCYRLAHAYLCMSEHEGFCAPLVEAMHFGVPVVARASSAIPETVGDAAALVTDASFPEVAETVAMACEEGKFREGLVARGRERARAFLPEAVLPRLSELVETVWVR